MEEGKKVLATFEEPSPFASLYRPLDPIAAQLRPLGALDIGSLLTAEEFRWGDDDDDDDEDEDDDDDDDDDDDVDDDNAKSNPYRPPSLRRIGHSSPLPPSCGPWARSILAPSSRPRSSGGGG
jgi:hypothetical protein